MNTKESQTSKMQITVLIVGFASGLAFGVTTGIMAGIFTAIAMLAADWLESGSPDKLLKTKD